MWHESTAFASYYFRREPFCGLASRSYDGEVAVRLIGAFGHGAVRGSSAHGGSSALHCMANALEMGRNMLLTLDGPKGPLHSAKAGASVLSARTQTPVIPVAFSAEPVWCLKSWDRFPVPRPFARIRVLFGPALSPPENDSRANVETARFQTESALNGLHDRI